MRLVESDKAVSEVVGNVIILALTITGIAMIMLVGVPSINRIQDMINTKNAEQTFTVLDTRSSKVALGETLQQLININLGGGTATVVPNSSSNPSYMLFEMKNSSATLVSILIPMGKVIYRLGEREIAYEGGGVWSKYPEGSTMLSPPEFNYNGVTITLPVANITGNSSVSGKGAASLRLEKKSDPVTLYPTTNPDYVNPISLNVSETSITIKSEYYDAWGDYFSGLSMTRINESASEKKVVVTLEARPIAVNFSYGALASESIILENNGQIDSYNSSKGKYLNSKSGNGSIRATKSIEIKNNAIVNGSALTGGVISGGGTIKKDANASAIGRVTVLGRWGPPVKGLYLGSTVNLVQSKINQFKTSNDNNDASNGNCLTGAGNSTLNGGSWGTYCTISAGPTGNYYFTTFSLINEKILIINTTSKAVNLVVDSSDFKLDNNANITVIGNNPVKLYLNRNFLLDNNALINPTTNDNSTLFQVISSSSQTINLQNNVYFCGFIWAPDALMAIDNNAYVYGALVGKSFTLKNNQFMHYDEALTSLPYDVGEGTRLYYLYITRYDTFATIS